MATENDERDDSAGDFSGLPSAPPPVTITETPDDDDDDGGEEPRQLDRDKKGRWAEKKSGRDKQRGGMRAELEALKGSNATLQQKLDAMTSSHATERQALMAALMSRQAQPTQQQAQQGTEADSEVKQLKEALAAERMLLAKDANRSLDRFDALNDQLVDARARAVARQVLAERQGGERETPDSSAEARKAVWQTTMESEFPWLAGNTQATAAAGRYRQYLLSTGKPDTIETVRLAIAHVGKEMGLGGRAAPTQRQRNGFIAPPAGMAAPSGGGPRTVDVDPRMLQGTGLSPQRLRKVLFSE